MLPARKFSHLTPFFLLAKLCKTRMLPHQRPDFDLLLTNRTKMILRFRGSKLIISWMMSLIFLAHERAIEDGRYTLEHLT